MARTKQTARRVISQECRPLPPEIKEKLEKRIRDHRNEREKQKIFKQSDKSIDPIILNRDKHHQFFYDIQMKTHKGQVHSSSSGDSILDETKNSLQSLLLVNGLTQKLGKHHYNETCFSHLPNVDMDLLREFYMTHDKIFNPITERNESNDDDHSDPSQIETCFICDIKTDQQYQDFAMRILDEFEKAQKECEFSCSITNKPFSYFGNSEEWDQTCYEFKTCGMICKFTRSFNHEICLFLISKDEYLYVGQIDHHGFFGMPYLVYTNSDGR